jgi:hypothetical protein
MNGHVLTEVEAKEIVEKVPSSAATPAFRKVLEQTLLEGVTNPEILQGMLAGLKFAHAMLLESQGAEDRGTHILTELTVVVAHAYLKSIDEASDAVLD